MILFSVAIVFFVLYVAFFTLSIIVDIVNKIRGKPSQYTNYFFLSGDAPFLILIASVCTVFLIFSLFLLYIGLKALLFS